MAITKKPLKKEMIIRVKIDRFFFIRGVIAIKKKAKKTN